VYTFAEEWAKSPVEIRALTKPPLLLYRDCLRAVWARNNPNGINLATLLGFRRGQETAKMLTSDSSTEEPLQQEFVVQPLLIPRQPLNPEGQTFGDLPEGQPVVNGITGAIDWEFSCELQRDVYNLMHNRWRAMLCPECGKYFIAAKTAQKHCSVRCYKKMKKKRALEYWHEIGSAKRDQRQKKGKKSQGRKRARSRGRRE
jgi:hypothetical protein